MVSYYLKFADEQSQPTDILGRSRDAKHPAWVEIRSLDWGITAGNGHLGNGHGAGNSSPPKDLVFTTEDSAASMAISRAYAFGTHYPTVVYEVVADAHVVMKLVISDAYVASFQSDDGPNGPLFVFSLHTPSVHTTLFGPAPPPAAPVTPRPPSPGRSAGNASGGKAAAHVRHGR